MNSPLPLEKQRSWFAVHIFSMNGLLTCLPSFWSFLKLLAELYSPNNFDVLFKFNFSHSYVKRLKLAYFMEVTVPDSIAHDVRRTFTSVSFRFNINIGIFELVKKGLSVLHYLRRLMRS